MVFGTVALMEAQAIYRQTHPDDNDFSQTVTIERGSVLRLKMSDFFKVIKGEDIKVADAIAPKLVAPPKKNTWELVMENLPLGLLKPVRLLPRSLNDPIFQYKQDGSIGRKLVIKRMDPQTVFILLRGAVRLMLCKEGRSNVECLRKTGKKLEISVCNCYSLLI